MTDRQFKGEKTSWKVEILDDYSKNSKRVLKQKFRKSCEPSKFRKIISNIPIFNPQNHLKIISPQSSYSLSIIPTKENFKSTVTENLELIEKPLASKWLPQKNNRKKCQQFSKQKSLSIKNNVCTQNGNRNSKNTEKPKIWSTI